MVVVVGYFRGGVSFDSRGRWVDEMGGWDGMLNFQSVSVGFQCA